MRGRVTEKGSHIEGRATVTGSHRESHREGESHTQGVSTQRGEPQ